MSTNEPEDSHDNETSNRVAGDYNETVPQTAPRFTKPANMHPAVAKPAGNMLRLKCPAEGMLNKIHYSICLEYMNCT